MARDRRKENMRKTISEKRNILKNADVSIKNNCISKIVLKSRLNGGSKYTLLANGDIEDIPFTELNDIFKRQRNLFESYKILIEDVYCPENDEITIDDVKLVLGLKDDFDETPDEYYFDELLLDLSFEEYEEEVSDLPKVILSRLIERAVLLYRRGEFSNFNKMSLLENKLGLEYVFEDVDRSKRQIKSDIDLF